MKSSNQWNIFQYTVKTLDESKKKMSLNGGWGVEAQGGQRGQRRRGVQSGQTTLECSNFAIVTISGVYYTKSESKSRVSQCSVIRYPSGIFVPIYRTNFQKINKQIHICILFNFIMCAFSTGQTGQYHQLMKGIDCSIRIWPCVEVVDHLSQSPKVNIRHIVHEVTYRAVLFWLNVNISN